MARCASSAAAPITVALSAVEGGGRIAPVAPGRYRAGVLAEGFFATPVRQAIEVAVDGALTVEFTLAPRGNLMGYVTADDPRPAGSLQPAASGLRVRSVQLSGAGGTRTLEPRPESEAAIGLAHVLDGQDDAWGTGFVFNNLLDEPTNSASRPTATAPTASPCRFRSASPRR